MRRAWKRFLSLKSPFLLFAEFFCCLAIFSSCSRFQSGSNPNTFISYRISLKDSILNVMTVEMEIRGIDGDFAIQSPNTGSGLSVEPLAIEFTSREGEPQKVDRSEGQWRVKSKGSDIIVTYDLLLMREDRFSADIRKKLSFMAPGRRRLLGRDLFLIPSSPVREGIIVDLYLASGAEVCSNYPSVGSRVVLPSAASLSRSLFVAGSYLKRRGDIGSTRITLACSEGWKFREDEMLTLIKDIVSHEIGMFGFSPHSSYLFVVDRNPVCGGKGFDNYGAHFNGNVILLLDPEMDRSSLFGVQMSIVSHEFFHTWNGEALRPASQSFQWFTEGVTVYYSYRVLLDLGVIDERQYLEETRERARRYMENPYSKRIPVADSGNRDMDDKSMVRLLYDGGFLAAAILEGRLDSVSGGRVGLVDVMKGIYQKGGYGCQFDEKALVREVKEMAGIDISDFLNDLVHTPASELMIRYCSDVASSENDPD